MRWLDLAPSLALAEAGATRERLSLRKFFLRA
jgi:hypothetical protein